MSLKINNEWIIHPAEKRFLVHMGCVGETKWPMFKGGYTNGIVARERNKCSGCNKKIPDHILFQWKLLNS